MKVFLKSLIYLDAPGQRPEALADAMGRFEKEMLLEKELFTLNNGTLSDIEIDPVILKEVRLFLYF